MIDPVTARRLAYRHLFVLVCVLILFVRILPLSTLPTRYPGPDLILLATLAWIVRRPDEVPLLVVVAVFLLEDLLVMRPPGLWTLLALAATEFLRQRQPSMRDLAFPLEWLTVGAIIAAMTLVNALTLALFMVPQSGAGYVLMQLVATIAAYPVVVAVLQWGLGVRRAAPGDLDAARRRL